MTLLVVLIFELKNYLELDLSRDMLIDLNLDLDFESYLRYLLKALLLVRESYEMPS